MPGTAVRPLFERLFDSAGLAGFGLLLLFGLAACTGAPSLGTPDEVPNGNEAWTALKDAHWDLYEWPVVDDEVRAVGGLDAGAPGGCAVGLAADGEIVYLAAYGDAATGQPWEIATVAPVGSVAKTLTAIAVMQLTEGTSPHLALSDTVGDHLATTSSDLAAASIDDLLSHTARAGGATKAAAFEPNWTVGPLAPTSLASPSYAYAQYEAGEAADPSTSTCTNDAGMRQGIYSNVGYSVLGAIVDEVTQGADFDAKERGYEPYIWHNVATLRSSAFDARQMLSLALTHSWREADGDFIRYAHGFPNEAWDNTGSVEGWEGPSGGWALTIGDLTRFAVNFGASDVLVEDATRDQMVERVSCLSNPQTDYGRGVMLVIPTQLERWAHGGTIGPHEAVWVHWPDNAGHSYSAALQCNNGTSQANLLDAAEVLRINALKNPNEEPSLKLSAAAPVDPGDVDGACFHLKLDTVSIEEPAGVFFPFSTRHDLVLDVEVDSQSGALELWLTEGEVRDGECVGDVANPTYLGEALYQGDPVEVGPALLSIDTGFGTAVFEDAVLTAGFAKRGDELAEVSLSARFDARGIVRGPGTGWRQLCAFAKKQGTPCKPCRDGARACLPVRFDHLRGERLAPAGAGSSGKGAL